MVDIFFKRTKQLRVRVAALIYNSRNEILLLQQKKKSKLYWLLPGGGIEYGEPALEALKRELKEELDLSLSNAQFLFVNESIDPNGKRHLLQLVFHVEVSNQPKITEQDRAIVDFRYFSIQEIKDLDLRPDIKEYLFNNSIQSRFLTSNWISD